MPTIAELENFRLSDAVSFNDELNPALWEDEKLKPVIRNKLMEIAQDFISYLGVKELNVKDITISGSNAAYSYTPHSDLDLHVIVDFNDLPDDEIYRELFNAKKTIYNDSHDIKVKGVPVELYVQDSNQTHTSLGEYSVLNDDWIHIPKKKRANFDEIATKAKFESLKELVELALKTRDLDRVENVLDIIKRYRKAGLEKAGEFGPENLAFKAIRKQGGMKDLFDLRNQLRSEKLSMDEALREHQSNTQSLIAESRKIALNETVDESEKINILSTYIARDIIDLVKATNSGKENIVSAILGRSPAEKKFDTLYFTGLKISDFNIPSVKDKNLWNLIKDIRIIVEKDSPIELSSTVNYTLGNYTHGRNKITLNLAEIYFHAKTMGQKVIDVMATTIAHELIHHVDSVKSDGKAFSPKAREKEYLQRPFEVNARVQELMYEVGLALVNVQPGEDVDSQKLGKYITDRFYRYAFDDLTQEQQRKIIKRAYKYARKVIESPAKVEPHSFARNAVNWILGKNTVGTLSESEGKKTAYHITLTDNLPLILKTGLRPKIGTRSEKIESNEGVYLFPDLASAEDAVANWLGDEFEEDDDLSLLKVDITGLSISPSAGYEIVVTEPISPDRIEVSDELRLNENRVNQLGLRFYKNPSPKRLYNLTKNSAHKHMRGLYHNGDTYWWDGNDAIHKAGAERLGIEYDYLIRMEAAIDSISDNYRVAGDDGVPNEVIQKYDIENEIVYEASGYIPSEKEKNDDRYKTALTIDVKTNSVRKNANAFNWKTNRAGVPPELKTSGKIK